MLCDKCGRPVALRDSAVILDAIADGHPDFTIFLVNDRHLLPVVEAGVTVCPGSPSRAQYLSGQPRDPRYGYKAELEARYRQAREEQFRQFNLA